MNLKLQHASKMSFAFLMALFSVWGWGQTAYTMSSGDKTWDLAGTWTVSGNTYTGTDAVNWKSVAIGGTGTEVTSGTRTTKSSATITTTTAGGLQKPSGTIQFLSTGSGTPPEAVAIDLLLDFTGRKAEALSFDWAAIDNSNGTRPTSLRVFWSINGTTFTELSAAQLLDKQSGAGSSGSITSVALPSEFNNVSTARIRFYNHAGNSTGSGNRDKFQIDNISITSTVLPPTWDGNQWVGGTPTASTDAIINGDYTGASFTANNVTVNSAKTLTINSGTTITANNITNSGAIIVNDGGNFIQNTSGVYSGSGTFTVNKTGASALDKYAFWSSPVAAQNLTSIYTTVPTVITEYDTATDFFVTASPTSAVGKGYSIKTPVANAAVTFAGTPNNGAQTFGVSTSGNGFNLVGNPYPSDLNLPAFFTANSTRVSSTFYFWDNTSATVTTQSGATTTNFGYATYNASGTTGTWTPSPNSGSVIPSGDVAKIGQGFFVKATNAADTSLSFANDMRVASAGTFFNKNTATEGKFWLKLNSSYNTNNTIAVTYSNLGLDTFDGYDSKAIATGSDAFYTTADTQKLIIQGKADFHINDVVPVGAKHFENGNFVISMVQKEGLFNNGQAIYLHDKQLGTYTNLQTASYSFAATAGEFGNRFEIVYKLDVLATAEVHKNTLEVYKDGEDFFVRNNKNIETVEVFDAAGRKVQDLNAHSKLVRVKLEAKGVYILKAVSEGKEYTKKIIK